MVAKENIGKGRYVCEYKTSVVFPAKDSCDEEHTMKSTYVMQTAFEVKPGGGKLCFDATNRFHHPGRYINHVAKGANLKPMGHSM